MACGLALLSCLSSNGARLRVVGSFGQNGGRPPAVVSAAVASISPSRFMSRRACSYNRGPRIMALSYRPRPLHQDAPLLHAPCQTANLVPAAPRRPGFDVSLQPPDVRGGGAPKGANNCRAGEARRAPCRGALAFRRSTLALSDPGTLASPFGICAEGCSETSSRPGRSTRQSFPGPPESAVASRGRRTPNLTPYSGSPLETAPHERDEGFLVHLH